MTIHNNSLLAYRQERPKLSRRAQIILDIYRSQPNRLFTDRDIQEVLLFNGYPAKDMNYCRPRITELTEEGLLEEVGTTIDRASKRPVKLTRFAQPQPATQMQLALA